MAVPPYEDFMLPLLKLAADGKEHRIRDCIDQLADGFLLSPEDRRELLPSGKMTRLVNRVHWAKVYLNQTRLLETIRRGFFRITDRGRSVLADNPDRVDRHLLAKFPELQEFESRTREPQVFVPEADTSVSDTPQERLESLFDDLQKALANQLLQQVRECSPEFFEQIVVELLVSMGYGGDRKDASERVGRSGDGGIDGVIKEDRLGLDAVYVQAKRWEAPVGRPIVQAFAGSLEGFRARKGVLITTSRFTPDAVDFVDRIEKRIVLINGEELARHMIEFNVGVTTAATYQVKRVDSDYFEE